jgi:uncharacterized membrane protein
MATAAAGILAPDRADTGMLNRMFVAVLALSGVLVSVYLTLYSFGMIGDLACGSGGCQTVQNSPWARLLGVPVALIGLVGYAVLFITALLGVQPRFAANTAVPVVLCAGAVIGIAFSAYLTYLEAYVIHAWCQWCVVSAAIAALIFAATLPEFRRLRRGT